MRGGGGGGGAGDAGCNISLEGEEGLNASAAGTSLPRYYEIRSVHTLPSEATRSLEGAAGSLSCTEATSCLRLPACCCVFLSNLMCAGQEKGPWKYTRWGGLKGQGPVHAQALAGYTSPPPPPLHSQNQQVDLSFAPWLEVRLEVVLVQGCGRGAFLQPLDVAGLAEETVLQGVAAVAILVVELQAAVLGRGRNVQQQPSKRAAKGQRPGSQRGGSLGVAHAGPQPPSPGKAWAALSHPPGHRPHVSILHLKWGWWEMGCDGSVNTRQISKTWGRKRI